MQAVQSQGPKSHYGSFPEKALGMIRMKASNFGWWWRFEKNEWAREALVKMNTAVTFILHCN
jgi:hypothetical protein